MESHPSYNVGDVIQRGDYISDVGNSGFSDGVHLHFEAFTNIDDLIDPWPYLYPGIERPNIDPVYSAPMPIGS